MKRCPNGTRRHNGNCVKKSEIIKKKCPNGSRRRNGICVKKTEISKKRCPNGSRRHNGICVKKSKTVKNKKSTPVSSEKKSAKYIVTFYNSNDQQIKDMDLSIDEPLDFVGVVERKTGIHHIGAMKDDYIPDYIKLMKLKTSDIDDDELNSVYYCDTMVDVKSSYDFDHDGKKYKVKFHKL